MIYALNAENLADIIRYKGYFTKLLDCSLKILENPKISNIFQFQKILIRHSQLFLFHRMNIP